LLNTSFQFGGALVLAIVTAVINAYTNGATPQGVLDGFHPALVVSVAAALVGAAAVGLRMPRRSGALAAELDGDAEPEVEPA
jgi:hypothetical protein